MSPAMDTLRTVLPVLLMLFIGAFCRRKAIISREGIQALKTAAVASAHEQPFCALSDYRF